MPPSRNQLLLLFAAIVAIVVLLAHEGIAGGRVAMRAIGEAVPRFSCPDMAIEATGGSWRARSRIARSVLRMPPACTVELKRRIRADPRFRSERCNIVERCWRRVEGARSYTFTFFADYTSFRYASD